MFAMIAKLSASAQIFVPPYKYAIVNQN